MDKAGYSYTAAYITHHFNIVSSEDTLEHLIRHNAKLWLCSTCKSLIYGISLDLTKQSGIGVNANSYVFKNNIPDSFKPIKHTWYANRIINFDDNLPKFKDAPREEFGSGELFE